MTSDAIATLERLTANAGQLYSLPAVAMQALELTNQPNVDTRALKECISNDPAITSKILRVVNSSLFGLSREVSDLNQAIALLGVKPLKLLVLGFSLPNGLFSDVESDILSRYWRLTLTKAVVGRELSETFWNHPGDEPFIAGLLQDLGMLLLIQQLGAPYVRFLDKVWATGQDLSQKEIESIGFDHIELSARVLTEWKLPESLIEAIAWKPEYSPNAAQTAGIAQKGGPHENAKIVHLAGLIAQLVADHRPELLPQVLEAGRAYRDISEARLAELIDSLQDKVRQLADAMMLQLPSEMDYRNVLIQAHEQLSKVACDAAGDLLRVKASQHDWPEEQLFAEANALAEAVNAMAIRAKDRLAPTKVVKESSAQQDSGKQFGAKSVVTKESAPMISTTPRRTSATAVAAKPQLENSQTFEATLAERIAETAAYCRQSRKALSLVLVELTHADELKQRRGEDGFKLLVRFLERLCVNSAQPDAFCLPRGESGFAVALPGFDRKAAIEYGDELIQMTQRSQAGGDSSEARALGISVGLASVAMVPKNFPAMELFTAADRCLYGSRASGGGTVKSIEIY